jgi:hypothetical protein
MGWQKIDDVLEALSFAARISHRSIIVISGDEVKRNCGGAAYKTAKGRSKRSTAREWSRPGRAEPPPVACWIFYLI